jgi:anti-sigma B factor antagonist
LYSQIGIRMSIINWLENNMLTVRRDANWVGRGDIEMEIIKRSNCIVVRCGAKTDRMDAAAANSLKKTMFKSVAKTARPDCAVILDLHGVSYIDDSGLGAILSVMQAMQEKTEMLLCGAGENLRKIFKLTRVDGVLQSYASVDEAEQEARRRMQKKQATVEGAWNASVIQLIWNKISRTIH